LLRQSAAASGRDCCVSSPYLAPERASQSFLQRFRFAGLQSVYAVEAEFSGLQQAAASHLPNASGDLIVGARLPRRAV
jgi:hypothetical protein